MRTSEELRERYIILIIRYSHLQKARPTKNISLFKTYVTGPDLKSSRPLYFPRHPFLSKTFTYSLSTHVITWVVLRVTQTWRVYTTWPWKSHQKSSVRKPWSSVLRTDRTTYENQFYLDKRSLWTEELPEETDRLIRSLNAATDQSTLSQTTPYTRPSQEKS